MAFPMHVLNMSVEDQLIIDAWVYFQRVYPVPLAYVLSQYQAFNYYSIIIYFKSSNVVPLILFSLDCFSYSL